MADHGWVISVDGEGNEYFFNTKTEESAWELPAGVDPKTIKKQPKWAKIVDGESFYFYNNVTGESTWEKPTDYDGLDDIGEAVDEPTEVEASKDADGGAGAGAKADASLDADNETKGGSTMAGTVASVVAASKWLQVRDEESGGVYYYNNETGECQWDKPADFDGATAEGMAKEQMEKILKAKLRLAALDSETRNKIKAAQSFQKEAAAKGKLDWVECYDPGSDAFYYTNKVTGATTWDKPENYIMAADDEMTHAVVKIQCMFRGKIARGEVTIKKKKKLKWVEVKDEETGGVYYFNNETGECQWDKPADYAGATAEGMAKEQMEKILKAKLRLAALDSETRNKIKAAQSFQKIAKEEGKLDWVECYDPGSDAFYYTNKVTGDTTWEKPENYIMAADDEMTHAVVKIQCMFRGKIARGEVTIKKRQVWKEVMDEESGKPYYHNTKTGDITWVRPDELGGPIVDPEEAARQKAEAEKKLSKALKVKLEEAKMDDATRKKLKIAKAKLKDAQSQGLLDKWIECYDPSADGFYYYNQVSGETTWDKPKDYVMAADDEMMTSVVKIQCLFRAKMARRRAEGMVMKARNITQEKHSAALERMKKLNEEELEMKREMERLRKEREAKELAARSKARAAKEERRMQQLSEEERLKEERAAQSQEAARELRVKRKQAKARAERERKQRRRERLAAIEEKMRSKREAEAKAKEEADRERAKQREIREMRRARAERLKKEKWKADCASWQELWRKTKKEEAARARDIRGQEHKEFMQQREAAAARARVAERRSTRHDAAVHSVWDAAMHGVSRSRANVLLNVALAEAAQEQAEQAASGAVEVVPGDERPVHNLSAGVGTAPDSKALYHIDVANEIGESPLHVAAWRGHKDVVAALIAGGADINVVDTVYSMTTPLHEAVRSGYRSVVKLLLDAGADITVQDSAGDTPLHWACRRGDQGIVAMILDADPEKTTPHILNYSNKRPGQLCKRAGVWHIMSGFEPQPVVGQLLRVEPDGASYTSDRTRQRRKQRRSSVAGRRSSVGRRKSSVGVGAGAGGRRASRMSRR